MGKAPGPDQLCGEILNLLPCDAVANILHQLYEQFAATSIPPTYLSANIWFIYKGKGEEDDPHSYRPISLMNFDLVLLSRWLLGEIRPHLTTWIPDTQQGFMPERWTINNIRYAQDLRTALQSAPFCAALDINVQGALLSFLDFKNRFLA